MADKLQTTLAVELASLPAIRAFIERACRKNAVSDQDCYDIKLAVEEACANVIEHGQPGLEPGRLILSVEAGDDEVVVSLTDFGQPFEPKEPPIPSAGASLETGRIGGFGLFFMHRVMDRVTYEAGAAGNTLTMIKRLDKN